LKLREIPKTIEKGPYARKMKNPIINNRINNAFSVKGKSKKGEDK